MMIAVGLVASANLGWAFLSDGLSDPLGASASRPAARPAASQVGPRTQAQGRLVQSAGRSQPRVGEGRGVSSSSAARPMYTAPDDPADTARRFFGEEAEAIAKRWGDESTSAQAAPAQEKIAEVYERGGALASVRNIECRTTLCRIRLDKQLATGDPATVKRMVGSLGPIGWIQRASTADEMVVFIPLDFEPL